MALTLDVLDVVCNGHLQHRDLASLRSASRSFRAQVDQTLQALRPVCDLSQLRQLPSTFRVLACVDLSAIDLRLLSASQLLSSSGGLTRHLAITLSQLPCLTELVISEAFAREMGRKCWAAAVCNSIFKDVVSGEQQQRQRQQQQQQLQQAAAAVVGHAMAAQAALLQAPPMPLLVLPAAEAAPEAGSDGGEDEDGGAGPQQSGANSLPVALPVSPLAARSLQQQEHDGGDLELERHCQQQEGGGEVDSHALQLQSEPDDLQQRQLREQEWLFQQAQASTEQQQRCGIVLEQHLQPATAAQPGDEGDSEEECGCKADDADDEVLACHMLTPGPSCLLDCPRELMWTSGFRAFDAMQFSISPASPPAGPALNSSLTPVASPNSAAALAPRNTAARERHGLPFSSAPAKLPSRSALLEATPSCPQNHLQLRWADDEDDQPRSPMQALALRFAGMDAGTDTPRFCVVSSLVDDAGEGQQGCAGKGAAAASTAAVDEQVQVPTATRVAASAVIAAGQPVLPCACARPHADGSASCGLLTTQGSFEGSDPADELADEPEAGHSTVSNVGESWDANAAAALQSPDVASNSVLAVATSEDEANLAIASTSSSGDGCSSSSSSVFARAQTVPGATANVSTSTSTGNAAPPRAPGGNAAPLGQGSAAVHPQRRRRDGDTGQQHDGSRPGTPTCAAGPAVRRSGPGEADSTLSEEPAGPSSTSGTGAVAVSSTGTAAEPDPSELAYFHSAAEDPHANMSAVVWLPDWPATMPLLHTLRIKGLNRPAAGSGMAGAAGGASVAAPAVAPAAAPAAAPSSSSGAPGSSGLAMTTLLWARRSALGRVRTIDLSGTRLGTLPPDLLSCCLPPSLRSLRLSGCGLLGLPASLATLTSLRELDISCNALQQLPDQISCLTNLTCLDASDNQLSALQPCLGACTALQRLDLAGNQLRNPTALPLRELASLPALAWMSLAHNWLATAEAQGPPTASTAAAVAAAATAEGDAAQHADAAAGVAGAAPGVSRAALPRAATVGWPLAWAAIPRATPTWAPPPVPWLGQLLQGRAAASVVYLDLSNAGPWDQPLALPWAACLALTALQTLNLSGNCGGLLLGPVPEACAAALLAPAAAATGLAQAAAEPQDLSRPVQPQPQPLPALQQLNISQCALEELPDLLCLLPHLHTLDARGNCLAALPPWIPRMAGLHHLHLRGNADLLQVLAAPGSCEGCISQGTAAWLRGVIVHQED